MEVSEIISYFLVVLFPGVVVWIMKLQNQVADLKTSVAVNATKDLDTERRVLELTNKIDLLIESVNEIKRELASS